MVKSGFSPQQELSRYYLGYWAGKTTGYHVLCGTLGKKISSHTHKSGSWYLSGILLTIFWWASLPFLYGCPPWIYSLIKMFASETSHQWCYTFNNYYYCPASRPIPFLPHQQEHKDSRWGVVDCSCMEFSTTLLLDNRAEPIRLLKHMI